VWWASTLGAFAVCLWLSNLLPIQRVHYELSTNLAISQHRFTTLQALLEKEQTLSTTDETGFRIISIHDVNPESQLPSQSELVATQITVRSERRVTVRELEARLDSLTTPTAESSECAKLAAELRKAKWICESYKHSLRRLALDTERDKNALPHEEPEESAVANEESALAETPESPFRVASFSFRSSRDPHALARDRLVQLIESSQDKVDSMTTNLTRHRELARGFLSFTGSPQITPVANALTRGRYLVLCIMAGAIWLFFVYCMLTLGKQTRAGRAPALRSNDLSETQLRDCESHIGTPSPRSIATSAHHDQVVRCLRSLEIAYLGAADVVVETRDRAVLSEKSELVAPVRAQSRLPLAINKVMFRFKLAHQPLRMQWLGDGLLYIWIAVFLLRISLDSQWRELAWVAPLAAISRLIAGIQ
jgi:hypothetical protein